MFLTQMEEQKLSVLFQEKHAFIDVHNFVARNYISRLS